MQNHTNITTHTYVLLRSFVYNVVRVFLIYVFSVFTTSYQSSHRLELMSTRESIHCEVVQLSIHMHLQHPQVSKIYYLVIPTHIIWLDSCVFHYQNQTMCVYQGHQLYHQLLLNIRVHHNVYILGSFFFFLYLI